MHIIGIKATSVTCDIFILFHQTLVAKENTDTHRYTVNIQIYKYTNTRFTKETLKPDGHQIQFVLYLANFFCIRILISCAGLSWIFVSF